MKILIDDGMQIKVGTGIGKYSYYLYKELCSAIGSQHLVELNSFDKGTSSKKSGRFKYLKYINSSAFRNKCKEFDIVHFTNYAIPFFRSKKTKYCVTIHDLASFIHPETLPKTYVVYNRFITKYAIKNADLVFTVSNSVKKEIIDRWPKYARKVRAAYPGLYSEFESSIENDYQSVLLRGLIEKKRFFLFVGTIEERKNLGIVLDAFIQLKKTNKADAFKLVLAGRPGFGYDVYKNIIAQSGFEGDIITTGYLSSEDVSKLYQEAAAYIFPSIYEGFGSTQLECMINHLPIILSNISTNVEISKNYGLFFNLNNRDELQKQMEVIINNEYDFKKKNGIAEEICERFRWSVVIDDYLGAYGINGKKN